MALVDPARAEAVVDSTRTKAATTPVPYHLLGRRGRSAGWNVALGFVVVSVMTILFAAVLVEVGYIIHEPRLDTQAPRTDLVWELAILAVSLAGLVPAVMLAARVVDRRPVGTLISIAGRVRWRWLLACAALSGLVALVGSVAALIVDPPQRGWGAVDWALVGGVAAVSLTIIPFQAAGEEYLFRGYLPQLIGRVTTNAWIPAVALSLVFAVAHGTEQNVWSFIDRAFFGLVAAWLTIRTGGLEAAIALHAVGNIAGLTLVSIDGELRTYLAEAEPPLQLTGALLDISLTAALALALVRVAERRRLVGRSRTTSGRAQRDKAAQSTGV